ncbi:MAG: UDP-N-acetylmuramoyl-tripeptide--D-alanyl-D-alanine ligase [Prevotella sp.]|nr:UDP-N-acetylmuramoyl-tripeptide--D-alanyl-D-alanine ligase [Prevotella sp.]
MDIKKLYQLYKQHPYITTDSRDCPEGSIFVALKGDSFDGNDFAAKALQQGCAYAIVDEPQAIDDSRKDQFILVDDCLQTFKLLAREHRRQFDIPVVGITGTNGKTTTKELVATVLAEQYNVMATQGNFNNDVGVPKTLFRLNGDHEIAVVEMGASHPGDIKTLVETAEPTCGLITNVGRAHLQGFGSFEGVKKTKGELYDYLRKRGEEGDPDHGFVFINADDKDLMQMADERGIILQAAYGTGNNEDIVVKGEVVECAPFLKFRWWISDEEGDSPKEEVQTHLIGSYNLYNMLAAISVGLFFDVDIPQINHALSNYIPSNNRSQLTRTASNTLIVDAYNANPTSMAAALKNFRDMKMENKMAILGDMRELGEASAEEHQRIADMLSEYGLTNTWLVGEEFGKTDSPFRKFSDVEQVKAAIAQEPPRDCCILIKGSNSIRLYQLPEVL